ncbi:unnamed protein product [Adineta steineri]|uniref:G-protein coupled receptors family 1 profile domain-containing protein n=1 Tax=Adineta steineri TaxID=433720 RepID=A0A819NS13_9BILA|nr:unnamed protein product [Adineta steineri]CAF4002844.1 unnamed protein product [Adineta steineri]
MNNTTTIISGSLSSSMQALRLSTTVLGILVYSTGFIGNFLSLLLFIQKELRQVSTGLTFLLLNIFSTIHLLSLLVEYLDTVFQVQVIPNAIFRCQFILWLQNATRTICSFLAATVSLDRFLRSEYPMKSRLWCTKKNVIKLFAIYCFFSVTFYTFFFDPLNIFNDQGQCSFPIPSTFRLFALNILPPIRFIIICVLPVIIMVGCGGRMLYNIQQSKKRVIQQPAKTKVDIATIIPPSSKGSNVTEETRKERANIDYMLLLMVLANVAAYIITQIPFNVYTLYYGYETSDDYTVYSLMRAFLLMWSSVYFGIGFYLFCITSPQFRKQFITKIKTLCVYHPHPPRGTRLQRAR